MENPSSGMLWFLALLLSLDKLSQYLCVCEAQRGGCDVPKGSKACFGCRVLFGFGFFRKSLLLMLTSLKWLWLLVFAAGWTS